MNPQVPTEHPAFDSAAPLLALLVPGLGAPRSSKIIGLIIVLLKSLPLQDRP